MPPSLSLAQCARAASAYRALIRAQRSTFKGDEFALKAGHKQSRALFSQFVPSSTSAALLQPSEIDEQIASAFEIADFFKKNVVQGIKNERGNFALRITKDTERGDNDTIKAPSLKEARPMRPPLEPNTGVKRRRRRTSSSVEA